MTDVQRTKLIKVLSRLGSEFDGERAAAGLIATRLLLDLRVTWHEVLAPAGGVDRIRHCADANPFDDIRSDARWALRRCGILPEREIDFLKSIILRRRPLTGKQATWLHDILGRLHVAETADEVARNG